MPQNKIAKLGLIAGKGVYPRLMAEGARAQGVEHLVVLAFRGETARATVQPADEVEWLRLGSLDELLHACRKHNITHVAMAGQLTPVSLFRVRLDSAMRDLLASLPQKNAHTIFGALVTQLESMGITVLPASEFMEAHIPQEPGVITVCQPSVDALADLEIGREVARVTSGLEIGQTVVIKEGVILAVEAFEGTDQAIRRAGKLGGPGAVVVKVAKPGHDMRFDIPVIGDKTLRVMRCAGAKSLAVPAGRAVMLEKEKLLRKADDYGIAVVVFDAEGKIQ